MLVNDDETKEDDYVEVPDNIDFEKSSSMEKTLIEEKTPDEKKKSKLPKIIIAVVVLLVVVAGVLTALKMFGGSIVGTWEYTLEDSENSVLQNAKQEFIFNEDGTAQANSYVQEILIYTVDGTYTTKGGVLTCKWDKQDEENKVRFKLRGDKMIFVNDDGSEQVFVRTK